jgi:hypothetical protein
MKNTTRRNDPCPCGSGQKYKKCCLTTASPQPSVDTYAWMDRDGLHLVAPGSPLTQEELERMTQAYQKRMRASAMWKDMVQAYGKEKAKELLKQCQVKPG